MAFSAQEGDNFIIMVIDRQLANALDKCLRIPNRLSAVLGEVELQEDQDEAASWVGQMVALARVIAGL